MRKGSMKRHRDELRPEYDLKSLKGRMRGWRSASAIGCWCSAKARWSSRDLSLHLFGHSR